MQAPLYTTRAVVRLLSTLLVVGLLASTTAAFALTEGLKLERSPILGTRVDKVLGPVCDCPRETARIAFRLREGDRLRVEVVDGAGEVVRELVRGRRYPAGLVETEWDGRDDSGDVVVEGDYQPRVHLDDERRTILLPNPMRVDVTPPRVEVVSVAPRVISPDGDGRRDRVVVSYRVDEPARGILLVDGDRRVLTRGQQEEAALEWYGKVDGEPLRRGVYQLELSAQDRAGNLAAPVPAGPLVVRYVTLGRDRIDAVAGRTFAVRVSSDAPTIRWQLGRRSGLTAPGTLRLRAPAQKGRYTLTVRAGGNVARAAVVVRPVGAP